MRIKPKREAVALLLARGLSISEAARQRNINPRTIHRWFAEDPTFRQHVVRCRDQLFFDAASRTTGLLSDVIATLQELTRADSEYVRVKAARALVEFGVKLRKDIEIEGRLQELERQLQLASPETKS